MTIKEKIEEMITEFNALIDEVRKNRNAINDIHTKISTIIKDVEIIKQEQEQMKLINKFKA